MAYSGYLVKVGTYNIPFEFIQAGTCKPVIHGQDLDSYTDSNGVTHRNALKNTKPIVEWDIPGPITETELRPFLNSVQNQYINDTEKSANVTAFFPEYGKYFTFKSYAPDIEFTIDTINEKEITYKTVHIKFIGYGGVS